MRKLLNPRTAKIALGFATGTALGYGAFQLANDIQYPSLNPESPFKTVPPSISNKRSNLNPKTQSKPSRLPPLNPPHNPNPNPKQKAPRSPFQYSALNPLSPPLAFCTALVLSPPLQETKIGL